jgi:altronate dehydratase
MMVVSLGCEKLQPERLLPPGSFAIGGERGGVAAGASGEARVDVVCLQDEVHLGFRSMIDSIMTTAGRIEDVGRELFRLMLDVASGRTRTCAERWKLHNALVLFNPAPIT